MRLNLTLILALVLAAAIFSSDAAAQTNSTAPATNDAVLNGILQIQEQLRAVQEGQHTAAETAKKHSGMVVNQLQSLEETVTTQRDNDSKIAHKTQQITLLVAGGFGVIGLAVLMMMVFFQWRVFTQIAQIAQISTQRHDVIAAQAEEVHKLAAPGRATVETTNANLIDVVGRLEKKISALEGGSRLLADPSAKRNSNRREEEQEFPDGNSSLPSGVAFDQLLSPQPENAGTGGGGHADALTKKAAEMEKAGQLEAALELCDRALAQNRTFTLALLQKGGLLNKLNRHDEALDCFEQALQTQDKKPGM
jgi:tetratricopeptide (TPR) repeat protein